MSRVWTYFRDSHTGGRIKLSVLDSMGKSHEIEDIYIEAPKAEASVVFFNRFGINPEQISCTCCGDDYMIDDEANESYIDGIDDFEDDGFRTGCLSRNFGRKKIVIKSYDIAPHEREGHLPVSGWVWHNE